MEKINQLLPGILEKFKSPETSRRQALLEAWRSIAGPEISPHSKPSLTNDGTLFVWCDSASLAFEINQRYKASLLKRAQAVVGEENIKKIFIRVGELR